MAKITKGVAVYFFGQTVLGEIFSLQKLLALTALEVSKTRQKNFESVVTMTTTTTSDECIDDIACRII